MLRGLSGLWAEMAKGVAGVCWNVKLMNAKFLGKRGGTTANAIKAVDYFTDLKTRHGLNLVATNNSWGGGGFSQGLLQDAIERANAANILFIAAAGNSGLNTDALQHYPSGYPNANIIAVASITSTGGLSSFSNYGLQRKLTWELPAQQSGQQYRPLQKARSFQDMQATAAPRWQHRMLQELQHCMLPHTQEQQQHK
jgi:hypothetical protein